MKKIQVYFVFSILLLGCNSGKLIPLYEGETQYLAFQLFTSGSTEPTGDFITLSSIISPDQIEDFFFLLQTKIGKANRGNRKLSVMLGPIALDNSDEEIADLINLSFKLAIQYDIAVGFHIDDGMFWGSRTDLWQKPENIEWSDWEGTPNESRFVDWVSARLAPHMCFNCPEVMSAMKAFMTNIATSIKSNLDELKTEQKEYLYSGVIVGWETSLDRESETEKFLGYNALTQKGFSSTNPPADIDAERATIVQEFIEFLAQPLVDIGLPTAKNYAHIAFASKKNYDLAVSSNPSFNLSYLELNNFSPPEIAIGSNYKPGFSTYPQDGLFEQIYALDNGNISGWASAEGTNIKLGQPPTSSGYSMESYLARHFNHGANLVTIFAFDISGDDFANVLNEASEGVDALEAYKKFLRGEILIEK